MPITIAELLNRSTSVIERLETAGIKVKAGSRLRRYVEHLSAALSHEYVTPPDDVLRKLHRLLIEVADLDEIVTALSTPPLAGWDTRVTESLSGGFLRTDESNHSRARDIQFELMVAALLRRCGYEPTFAEPDVRVTVGGVLVAVAAKRPRSRSKVQKIAKKAAKQIIDLGLHGLVAMDATVVANPDDKHITTRDPAATQAFVSEEASKIAKYVIAAPAVRYGTDRVFGALVRITLPIWLPDERTLSFASQWRLVSLIGQSDSRVAVFQELYDRILIAENAV